jgi:hypothetical protein
VDQAADAGDQQREQDRQLIDLQPDADVPVAGADPVPQVQTDGPLGLFPAEQLDEQSQAEGEGDDRRERAEEMAPAVAEPADQQQDRGADQRHGDQQPGIAEQAVRRHRRRHFQQDHVVLPNLIGCSLVRNALIRTSTGSRRPPRPSGGSGRW